MHLKGGRVALGWHWGVNVMILVNHNAISGFLLSLSQGFFVFLYTCDIVVGQCHMTLTPQCHPVLPRWEGSDFSYFVTPTIMTF